MQAMKATTICLATVVFALIGTAMTGASQTPARDTLMLYGLQDPVELIRDRWGISHIYAKKQADLFFAQGFNAARDRLFQFEMWRRRALGTLAEIQGAKALQHDIGARLLRFRGDLERELAHYHPEGKAIVEAFVRGVNAYIEYTQQDPSLLPIEFRLLGIEPGFWTPEIVISRHNGLYRNGFFEIQLAQAVRELGPKLVAELLDFQPGEPDLSPKDGLDLSLISEKVTAQYWASRFPPDFAPEDIILPRYRAALEQPGSGQASAPDFDFLDVFNTIGSNNWALSGAKTASGFAIMANDPHRRQQIPSLRYWVHLNAPGWNVIGGGEPALPGVSIGHNDFGAWGLTIFSIDQEDIFVYDTNPQNPDEYHYQDTWEPTQVLHEEIKVRGQDPVQVRLKFTRHGPVIYEDLAHKKIYGLKAAWLETGTAPYLSSLRMDQASTWEAFRDACRYFGMPSENMVWADKNGTIGWQATGMAPLRGNWDGLLPVPGDGRFEWKGYLPILELPHVTNPPEGFIASANQNNLPPGYPHFVGRSWSEPFRYHRLLEVLSGGRRLTLMDNMLLQHDELSLPARSLVPLLRGIEMSDPALEKAAQMLFAWDFILDKHSAAAALYVAWEWQLSQTLFELLIPENGRRYIRRLPLTKVIQWLTVPDGRFGSRPLQRRDSLLVACLQLAVRDVESRFGKNTDSWRYGDAAFHHIRYTHELSQAVNANLRKKLDLAPQPRGGYGYTVNNTSNGNRQTSGASFRIIADTGDWDRSVGTNTPGQSGNPDDPHYANLYPLWANGRYFPIFFSREKVDSVAESILILMPQ